jgi:nitroreductase
MEFTELLLARHSIRSFRPDPVPAESVERILQEVRTAPTAGNFQSYEIYVVRGAERMKALASACFNHEWVAEAPMALIVCTHAARCQYDNPQHWAIQDASIAATLAHLAIVDLGLATCWVGAFIPAKVAELFEIPAEHTPLALLPFGYANQPAQESPRREIAEFVHWKE